MARLDQALLQKLARRLGKTPQYIREQVSRRAGREGVVSSAALVMWARDLGIGVSSAVDKLPPHVQQQLSVPRVVEAIPRQTRSRRIAKRTASRRSARRGTRGGSRRASGRRRAVKRSVFVSHSSDDK